MIKRNIVAAILLSVLSAVPLCAQPAAADYPVDAITIEFVGIDAAGHKNAVHFGVHEEATYYYNYDLGEFPTPPVPMQGAFDLRLIDLPNMPRDPSDGCYLDMRKFHSIEQTDTFQVRFQPSMDNWPMRFTWRGVKSDRFKYVDLEYETDSGMRSIDMLSTGSLAIDDNKVKMLRIILNGVLVREPKVKR
ncbi:MAG: hypothetical protein CL946_00165 [Ectothiorhodospiraceae bacterium]|nr:hypothetical protein [Ectothiorhodospiraceae bacterium]